MLTLSSHGRLSLDTAVFLWPLTFLYSAQNKKFSLLTPLAFSFVLCAVLFLVYHTVETLSGAAAFLF